MDAAVPGPALEKEPSVSLPFPSDPSGRMIYGIYVVLLPAVAFWGMGASKPLWQSGQFSDYLALFLTPEASWLFILLLIYSIICYLLLLYSPDLFSKSFFIRLGIYTGTLLALQYSVLAGLYFLGSFGPYFILAWIFPIVLQAVYRWAIRKWDPKNVVALFILIFVGAFLVSLLVRPSGEPIMFLIMAFIMSAPFWSLLIAGNAALWSFRNYETKFSLPRGFGLTAWLAAYALAWRFDILKMYELYAALPKQPPDCYIATAAARGHVRVVRAWTIQRADGKSMQVNRQLQRLKCAELALMATQPRLHRLLRQLYDVVGRYLARRIQNPFVADVAYLLLKPCEWTAGIFLKIIVPESESISKKMYR